MQGCPEVRALLPGAAGGELDPEQERLVRSHALVCDECARELEDFSQLRGFLRHLPDPAPPPGLAEKVLDFVWKEEARRQVRRGAYVVAASSLGAAFLGAVLGWAARASLARSEKAAG